MSKVFAQSAEYANNIELALDWLIHNNLNVSTINDKGETVLHTYLRAMRRHKFWRNLGTVGRIVQHYSTTENLVVRDRKGKTANDLVNDLECLKLRDYMQPKMDTARMREVEFDSFLYYGEAKFDSEFLPDSEKNEFESDCSLEYEDAAARRKHFLLHYGSGEHEKSCFHCGAMSATKTFQCQRCPANRHFTMTFTICGPDCQRPFWKKHQATHTGNVPSGNNAFSTSLLETRDFGR